ncbi:MULTISPECIES: hypothetical protein [Nostocales]|uniref:Uncharacterized protein n=4 Tax=Nostocales TaxID=1161 RepID=A0A8S9T2B5_9CYAN|nr:hypothetical protein [Tolypothrix bouteillei]KAF3886236.1 hypothetical protein DA73_0400012680 [Tolypothrix bouteillei VB521301]
MPNHHEFQKQNQFSSNSKQIFELDDSDLDNIVGGVTSGEQARKEAEKVRETLGRVQYVLNQNSFS